MPDLVYVVDDDQAVRESLALLLETAGCAVQCYESAESFLASYRPDMPGCLVLDVRLDGMSGPELQRELARRDCHLPVIFLTAYGDIPMTVRAMKAGAVDFLTKPVSGAELLDRVHEALAHDRAAQAQRRSLAQLTDREREILKLVIAGHPNKAIGRQLGISHRTVELHRSRILQKTGRSNMLELASDLDLTSSPDTRG